MTSNPFIVPPREELVGQDRKITRSWWRYFDAIFKVLGGGSGSPPTNSLPGIETQAFSALRPQGRDYSQDIGALSALALSTPHPTNLEARVGQLETLLRTLRPPPNVEQRIKDVETLAYALNRLTV